MKKINKILIIVIILNILFSFNITEVTAVITTNLPVSTITDKFPDSYMPYINDLKSRHPNWVFKAVNTNLEWDTVIEHETYLTNTRISLVPESYPDSWKRTDGTISRDGSFVTASIDAVKYVMDPRNSLNETYIFQFETLSYTENSLNVTQKILESTPMGSTEYMQKYKNADQWIDMEKTYYEIINEAGRLHDVNPSHIASRIKQETSGDIINNRSINGSYPGLEGYYNFFNIDATPNADGTGSVYNGLVSAKNKGWDTPTKSINAGAEFLSDGYIKWGQNTIYFQKFDVNNPGCAVKLLWKQYMTNIIAPRSEATLVYNGYNNAELLDCPFEFHIPVYLNMPESICLQPGISSDEYTEDNTKVYLDDKSDSGVNDTFNIRTTPDSSSTSNILKTIIETEEGENNRTIFTRILKGPENGYDKIRLEDGREGYVFNKFVYEHNYTKVNSISFNNLSYNVYKDETVNLEHTINPFDAKYKDVRYSSNDTSIATVNNEGLVTGIKSGNCNITITSEDQNKTATCEINVKLKQDIELDKDKYTLKEDESIDFNVITEDEYSVTIEDTEIAVIEDNKIKGLKVGTTKIKASINDTDKYVESVIEVKTKEEILNFDESLDVKEKEIKKVGTLIKLKDFKNKINTNLDFTVKDINNNPLSDEDNIGTGTKIEFSNGNIYTVIIEGDVNGDGKISASDYVYIKNYIMETKDLSDIQKNGADYSGDGKVSASDYVKIKNYIMN